MTYLTNYNWMKKPYLDSKENHHTLTPSLFKQTATKILKIRNSILFTIIFVAFAQVCWGQSEGDYRSKGSANWNDVGPTVFAWEKYDATLKRWVDATVVPSLTTNVTILNGHTIILDDNGSVNSLTITGGTLTCNTVKTLSANGNFVNNGICNFEDGTIILTESIEFPGIGSDGTTNIKNLVINPGVICKGYRSFNITGVMTVNGTFIPSGSISINANGKAGNLTCNGTIKVTNTYGYAEQYKFTSDNLSSTSVVEYAGNSAQAISPINYYKTLTINNKWGCSLVGIVTCTSLSILKGKLTVTSSGKLDVTGSTSLINFSSTDLVCLLLKSDPSSSASFTFTNYPTGSGRIMVERYMSNTDKWHLYSSPINDQSIHDFLKINLEIPDLLDGSGNVIGVGMRDYDTANDCWKLYRKTELYPWNPYFVYENTSTVPGSIGGGKGFSIRTISTMPASENTDSLHTVYASGLPNPNDFLIDLTIGWNCIGNPFTCAMDPNDLVIANPKFITEEPYKYVYTWDSKGGIYSPENPLVQTGQGFFVKSTAAGKGSFTGAMRHANSSTAFKDATLEWPSIKIVAQNQSLISSTKIKFVENSTKGLDPGYDAGMLKANKDFALYSRLIDDIGIDFCIQSLPDQNYDQYVIPIGIDFKAGGDITFTAETVNLPSGCLAVLEDRQTNRFTRLDLKDTKYTTTVNANTKGTGRFFLHTSDVISGDQPIEKEQFKIIKIGRTLYINGVVSDKANFFIYSVNGKQLANFKAESQVQNQFDASGLPAGVYILTTDDQNQKKSTKFVIEN